MAGRQNFNDDSISHEKALEIEEQYNTGLTLEEAMEVERLHLEGNDESA